MSAAASQSTTARTTAADTVIIGGRVRKRRGRMIGVNMEKFRLLADESRNYLFTKANYKLDISSKG